MSIFALLCDLPNEGIEPSLAAAFPDRWYKIASGQYFISTGRLTAKQVSIKLGLPDGKLGRAVVLSVSNYSGWHSKDMWTWLNVQSKESDDADAQAPE